MTFKKRYKERIKKIKKEYEQELKRTQAVLVHDIKTPLLAQIQTLDLLLKGTFGALNLEQSEILKEILNSNCFLYEIVSNLIFLNQTDFNEPKLENVDVLKQVEECVNIIKFFSDNKNQKIVVKSNSKEVKLEADKRMIQKIIFNLLSGSVAQGYENSKIEVYVDKNENAVSFRTKNKSAYMTKEKIKSLFEKKETTRDFNQIGMSLNLNVAAKLARAHKWDIVAESDSLEGSTFGFVVRKNQSLD